VTFCVYQRQWIAVYTSDADGEEGGRECHARFEEKYQGCVHPDEFAIEWVANWPAVLSLFVPALVGEFSLRLAAEHMINHRGHRANPYEIVEQGSPEEQALRDYGRKKLPV
jgi:hypothetical protein